MANYNYGYAPTTHSQSGYGQPGSAPYPGSGYNQQTRRLYNNAPTPNDFTGDYAHQAQQYQDLAGSSNQLFGQQYAAQQQYLQQLGLDPNAALFQQYLGSFDPNLGSDLMQQLEQLYAVDPRSRQSTATYMYGF